LYFLGLYWQWTRGSALIGWVKDDAEFIADQIHSFQKRASLERDTKGTPTPVSASNEGA